MSEQARERMVRTQLESRDIDDERVLEAFRQVPRERFVPEDYRDLAHRDGPIPIGRGQTISQPYVVALMTQALSIEPGDRVLEVGTGSGYQAAILAELDAEVFTVERHEELADFAREVLEKTGYDDVDLMHGDGTRGWAEHAPYDAILVTAAGPTTPKSLLEQLKVGGRLVIPVEEGVGRQQLVRVTRKDGDEFDRESLGAVAFVPLIGEEGWDEDRGRRW